MLKPVLAALLLLSTPVLAFAPQGEGASASKQDAASAYKELVRAYNEAFAAWRKEAGQKVKEAQEAGQPLPAIAMTPPSKEFVSRAQELAAEYAGTDDAVRFLVFVCKYASKERNAVHKAIATLHESHAESASIGDALGHLEGAAMGFGAKDKVMALLDAVVERNKHETCIAQALLARGALRLQTAQTDDERAEAKADLDRVATVTKDEDLVKQAKDALFEIEHLQVGCEAPDIAGKDVDGVDFKLSDYRGKVVLIDFWGFW